MDKNRIEYLGYKFTDILEQLVSNKAQDEAPSINTISPSIVTDEETNEVDVLLNTMQWTNRTYKNELKKSNSEEKEYNEFLTNKQREGLYHYWDNALEPSF